MQTVNPSIFKAYDIRGVYPADLNEEISYRIGQGYANVVKPKTVALGKDVRTHGPQLWQAMSEGLTDAGVDVTDIGTITTEMLYFAVGKFGYDGGITVSASHNPAEWNGFKMVGKGAAPISSETGINEIRDYVIRGTGHHSTSQGSITKNDRVLDEYVKFVLTFARPERLRPLRLVANPNFGMAGVVLDRLIEVGNLPIEIIELNYQPDGTFPKGRPDPFLPENRPEIERLVKKEKTDLGVAWDADADRVFFVTEQGDFIEPVYLSTALVEPILERYPGSNIIFDVRYIYAMDETVRKYGGRPIITRVGHSFIKQKMREVEANWAGESSAHYYYKDNYYADSGMITLMILLNYLDKDDAKLYELVNPIRERFFVSGEINFKVEGAADIMKGLDRRYRRLKIDRTDGITVEGDGWRANVRASNTEPLLRLNVESKNTRQEMLDKVKEFTRLIDTRHRLATNGSTNHSNS